MTQPDRAALLRSHHELRAALILAGRRIRRLSFGRKDDPLLPLLRKVLKEAREVARSQRGEASFERIEP